MYVFDSGTFYVLFVLVLGSIAERWALKTDYMISEKVRVHSHASVVCIQLPATTCGVMCPVTHSPQLAAG